MKFILVFFPFFLYAIQYWISFQYTVYNKQVINQKLEYARCMHEINTPTIASFKYFYHHKSLKDVFKYEQNEIIDMLSKSGIILHNTNRTINFYPDDKIKITYLPQRFDIIYKDGYLVFNLKGTE
jgi:hypothetical protein